MDFMGEAEGRQQPPAALADRILRERVTLVTAGALFPLVVGGIWEEGKPHAPDTSENPLTEAAARSGGRARTGHAPSLQHMLTRSSSAVCWAVSSAVASRSSLLVG